MKKNKIILLLALTLAFALAFSGCGGPQVPADDLPVIATPNVDPSTLERVNVFYAEFPADTTTWVLDDSTEPYVLYYADSLMSDRACNFSVNIGQPFDHSIDQEVLDAFVESYTTANVFITENLSELRLLNGQPVIYTESSLHYTDETIDYALENGIITEELMESLGGREFFLNTPPMDQVTICPVIDGYLCVFTGTYFDQEQKQAILDAIAIATTDMEVF